MSLAQRLRHILSRSPQHGLKPCVMIYNPLSGHGHLDSWNALFVGFLLERGYHVVSLSPGAEDLRARLSYKGLLSHPQLYVARWGHPQRSLYERVRGRLMRIIKRSTQDTSSIPKNDPEAGYLLPTEFAQRVRSVAHEAPWRPDFVFNMYMDLYRTDRASWQPFDAIQKIGWAGIRFVPSALEGASGKEAYYELSSLRGMCFLDEDVCKQYRQSRPQQTFGYLPDITETALPETVSALVSEIKKRACGRTIVFMGGTIGSNKNLDRWCQVIKLAEPNKWFFVQIGEVHINNLLPEERIAFAEMQSTVRENLFLKAEYLQDEKVFNEVIHASDILFAVYRNFVISSNMPGKAAAFNKPILVASGHLMGSRVEQYMIGRSVSEDSPQLMLEQLEALVQSPPSLEAYAAYRRDFSHAALCHNFFEFLDKVNK
jgi:hypothetical protein